MRSGCRRRSIDDSGVSLLIVLAFVTFVGLISGAVLSYSGVSLTGTRDTKYRTDLSYDVDGTLKAGINQVRNGDFDNDYAGQPCDLNGSAAGGTLALDAATTNSKQRMAVTCAAGPGTGVDGGIVGINPSNKPGQAILTLGDGTGGEVGIQQSSNAVFRVKGKVFTNSSVSIPANNARLEVLNAELNARLGCTAGKVISQATPPCGNGAIPLDPNYPQPMGPLTLQPVPNCVPGGVVQFAPGFYDDATALNTLMASCTALFWFPAGGTSAPARYYFDFATNGGLWQLGNSGAAIVAGEPSGWSPSSPTALADARARIGAEGACVSPLKAEGAKGAQFIFGGTSRLAITSGYAEICGKYSSDIPMLPIYGAKVAIPGTVSGPVSTAMTTATSVPASGPGAWAELGKAVAGDSDAAASVTAMPASSSSTATLTGFNPSGGIGPGYFLTSAVLKVRHREVDSGTGGSAGKVTGIALTVQPSTPGTAPISGLPVAVNGGTSPALTTQSIDLTSQLKDDFKLKGWSGASITYAASTNNKANAAAYLESVVLEFTWRTAALSAQSGCITAGPYVTSSPSASAAQCPVLYTSGAQVKLFIQGTTYVPRAAVDINLTNISTQVMRAGLIARTLWVGVTPSAGYLGPVIEVPDNAAGPSPTEVYFRAYYCPEGSSCSSDPAVCPAGTAAADCVTEQQRAVAGGWRLGGTARTSYTDPTPGSPSPGSRAVNVKSWTIYR